MNPQSFSGLWNAMHAVRTLGVLYKVLTHHPGRHGWESWKVFSTGGQQRAHMKAEGGPPVARKMPLP
jgi:hypothetical protein